MPKLTAPHKWLNCKVDLKADLRQCVTTVEAVDLAINSASPRIGDDRR